MLQSAGPTSKCETIVGFSVSVVEQRSPRFRALPELLSTQLDSFLSCHLSSRLLVGSELHSVPAKHNPKGWLKNSPEEWRMSSNNLGNQEQQRPPVSTANITSAIVGANPGQDAAAGVGKGLPSPTRDWNGGFPLWTVREKMMLLTQFHQEGRRPYQMTVPGRTRKSIMWKAEQLGLRRASRRWTRRELSSLQAQVEAGVSRGEIKIHGRTRAAIYRRLLALELYQSTRRWSRAQTKSLVEQVRAGVQPAHIRVEGKDKGAIYSKMVAMKFRIPDRFWQRKWTTREQARLAQVVAAGNTVRQIRADQFPHRTVGGIRAKTFGIRMVRSDRAVVARKRRRFTGDEVTLLETLFKSEGLTAIQIARSGRLPGRTYGSIHAKMHTLGLVDARLSLSRRGAKPWTEDENRLLVVLVHARHWSVKQIVASRQLPGRTVGGICQQMNRLRLANPIRSAKLRAARRLRGAEKEKYFACLREQALKRSPEEIAAEWKRSPDTVRADIRKLGLTLPKRKRGPSPGSIERIRRAAKVFQTTRWAMWWVERKKDLRQLRRQIHGSGDQVEERACKTCGETWPLTKDFFRQRFNLRGGERKPFFSRSCVLCQRRSLPKRKWQWKRKASDPGRRKRRQRQIAERKRIAFAARHVASPGQLRLS
jgi:hypothetical protein